MNPSNTVKVKSLANSMLGFTRDFLKFNIGNYRLIPFFCKTFYYQKKGVNMRAVNRKNGIHIPTILALSITSRCNLDCTGCYYKSQERKFLADLPDSEIIRIFKESRDLGIRDMLILGGEPLTRDIFRLTEGFDDILFAVFTNSMLFNDDIISKLRKRHNIIPVLSLEGCSETDKRRGNGVLQNIKCISALLKKNKILYGLSYTVTRNNFDEIIRDDFVRTDIRNGCVWFSFLEYVPFKMGTNNLLLTVEQKNKFVEFMTSFRDTYKIHVLSQILETVKHGGCSAANDVLHISSGGALEPCPFIPYSDTSVLEMPLIQALKSPFLEEVRNQLPSLENIPEHSCKLFNHKNWIVKTLARLDLVKKTC